MFDAFNAMRVSSEARRSLRNDGPKTPKTEMNSDLGKMCSRTYHVRWRCNSEPTKAIASKLGQAIAVWLFHV